MTTSQGNQYRRRVNTGTKVLNDIKNKYGDNTSNALKDYLYQNPSLFNGYGIHKSSSKGFNQQGMMDNIINSFTQKQKDDMNRYLTGLNNTYNWQNSGNFWSDDKDDAFIDNFVTEKYDSALEQLDRALKRGSLNDSMYQSALNSLNDQRNIYNANAQDIGRNIMNNYGQNLLDAKTNYDTAVDNFDLSQFNLLNTDKIKQGLNDVYNQDFMNLDNDLLRGLSSLGNFDVASLIGDAKVVSGINNMQGNNLLNAIEDTEKKKDQQIGLGNQGLF